MIEKSESVLKMHNIQNGGLLSKGLSNESEWDWEKDGDNGETSLLANQSSHFLNKQSSTGSTGWVPTDFLPNSANWAFTSISSFSPLTSLNAAFNHLTSMNPISSSENIALPLSQPTMPVNTLHDKIEALRSSNHGSGIFICFLIYFWNEK